MMVESKGHSFMQDAQPWVDPPRLVWPRVPRKFQAALKFGPAFCFEQLEIFCVLAAQ